MTATNQELCDGPETFERVIARLAAAKSVAIFTHQRPDPDALGSQAASAIGLKRAGLSVQVVNFEQPPLQYRRLQDGLDGIRVVDFTAAAAEIENACDTYLCVDTCTYQQLEPARALLLRHKAKVVALDHHLSRDELGPFIYTDTSAAACVELVARMLSRLNIPLDPLLAQRLFAGLVADTGWFRFDNVTSASFALAATLVAAAAQPSVLYQQLMQNETPSKLGLMQRALASLQWYENHQFACMVLSQKDFGDAAATQSQTEYLVDLPMQVGTCEVAAIMSETPDGQIRTSLRSKQWVNVSAICNQFGGGGHIRAAGCRLSGPLEKARENIVRAVETALRAPPVS